MIRSCSRWFLTIWVVVFGGTHLECNFRASVVYGDESGPVSFEDDVKPILQARCDSCHGSEEREGGLRFLGADDLYLRNDSGEPAVVAGHPEKSELIRRITADEFERMPPEGTALNDEQIAVLKQWITEGAPWPKTETLPTHWAYVPPAKPAIPDAAHLGRVANPVDAFVLTRLADAKVGLQQSPVADPATVMRRVHLDLVGLPPSPEVVKAFEADPSYAHYVRVVEELLASPRYGEKWARQWLDLARYADSNGFQADQFREIWAYRDWVIKAFNSDLPFDQFTIEQLAGDLLPDATPSQKIATGFHRCTTCNVEAGVDPEENRTNQVIDRVNTTGTVWLGTTLECAQCHNHKYDPFSQEDYYQILAFFNNTPLEVIKPKQEGVQFEVSGPKMALPLPPDVASQLDELQAKKSGVDQRLQQRRQELADEFDNWQAKFSQQMATSPQWHVLQPQAFSSSGGASHEILDDQSVLVTGKAPDKDEYTIRFQTELDRITGFKLETLTHDSLPGKGPGRGDDKRPNFVAYELTVKTRSHESSEAPTPIGLHTATADFSQNNYAVAGLIDGDAKTAWAINPKFHESHWASFLTTEPIQNEDGLELSVTIDQHYGGARTIGRLRFLAMTGDPGIAAVPEEIRKILSSDKSLSKADKKKLKEYQSSTDTVAVQLENQQKKFEKQIAAIAPPTTLVMVESDEPRMTKIFKRGNFLDPGAEVDPNVPDVLHSLKEIASESDRLDRLEFAKWIVSEENPLVARAAVNRWWAEFFGSGIVETLEDFGTQGELPTHPQLLDWLATNFIENGWSMKHVHRQIVLSETYRQSSSVTSNQYDVDAQNKWLARGSRVRLAAETIRDNALAASGLISFKMGGPPVYPPQPENIWRHVGRNAPKYATDTDADRFRRGIYVVWRRSAPYPSFVNFDAPDRGTCVVQRSRTNTPLQALTLLNDPAYVEMAQALGKRLLTDLPDADDRTRVERGFRLVASRAPTDRATNHLLTFLNSERQRFKNDPSLATKLIPRQQQMDDVSAVDQAVYFEMANILLNLDETITKN